MCKYFKARVIKITSTLLILMLHNSLSGPVEIFQGQHTRADGVVECMYLQLRYVFFFYNIYLRNTFRLTDSDLHLGSHLYTSVIKLGFKNKYSDLLNLNFISLNNCDFSKNN